MITKEQASDLMSLQDTALVAAITLEHAMLASERAKQKLAQFIAKLQQEDKP